MPPNKLTRISQRPFFLYLLPVSFVLHGFTESYFLVPIAGSFFLIVKYFAYTLALNIVLFFVFKKDNVRASFVLFVVLLIYFFFGAFHDVLKSIAPGSFVSKYSFILPTVFLSTAVAVMLIRRIARFTKATVYLNVLFLIFIAIDVFSLGQKASAYDRRQQLKLLNKEFTLCDSCYKPDIYLIVADEYAGQKTLADLYDFDNSQFLNQLHQRKFVVIKNSTSNYNITPISIASLLNLDYVKYTGRKLSEISMRSIYNLIDTNMLVPFLRCQGYEFINNSIFTVNGQSPLAQQSFTPVSTGIIESQTLFYRLARDLGYHLINWHILKSVQANDYAIRANNNKVIENIKKQVLQRNSEPRISYSHLTMPHFPYYFDSKGKPYPQSTLVDGNGNEWHEDRYLEYLKYANDILLRLIDFILQNSQKPPVIILISDHGWRRFSKNVHREYDFYNLIATFLPPQYSAQFGENMTNASYIRSLLNALFQQHLSTDKQARFYIRLPGTPDSSKVN